MGTDGVASGRRVVLISRGARRCRERLAALEASGFELVERYDLDMSGTERDLIAALQGAWAVVAGTERYTPVVLDSVDGLRVIARCGVGYDAIDIAAATRNGVVVVITPGANSISVAEFAITLMLASLRRLVELDGRARQGTGRPNWIGRDLAGCRVGLVGLGSVGREVASRLAAFGCVLFAVEPNPDLEFCRRLNVRLVSLEELLPEADILSLHATLDATTHHLIGRRELALLRPGALLINTARGGLVDQAALTEALASGRLGGAGLDVFESEPLRADDPLCSFPSVVVTPHVAASTDGAVVRMIDHVQAALVDLANGTTPRGVVNPEAFGAAMTSGDALRETSPRRV